jgi:hypothetical protein
MRSWLEISSIFGKKPFFPRKTATEWVLQGYAMLTTPEIRDVVD